MFENKQNTLMTSFNNALEVFFMGLPPPEFVFHVSLTTLCQLTNSVYLNRLVTVTGNIFNVSSYLLTKKPNCIHCFLAMLNYISF